MQLDLDLEKKKKKKKKQNEKNQLHSKADSSKQKWNGLVSCNQHSYFGTCPFKEGDGGAGGECL